MNEDLFGPGPPPSIHHPDCQCTPRTCRAAPRHGVREMVLFSNTNRCKTPPRRGAGVFLTRTANIQENILRKCGHGPGREGEGSGGGSGRPLQISGGKPLLAVTPWSQGGGGSRRRSVGSAEGGFWGVGLEGERDEEGGKETKKREGERSGGARGAPLPVRLSPARRSLVDLLWCGAGCICSDEAAAPVAAPAAPAAAAAAAASGGSGGGGSSASC